MTDSATDPKLSSSSTIEPQVCTHQVTYLLILLACRPTVRHRFLQFVTASSNFFTISPNSLSFPPMRYRFFQCVTVSSDALPFPQMRYRFLQFVTVSPNSLLLHPNRFPQFVTVSSNPLSFPPIRYRFLQLATIPSMS